MSLLAGVYSLDDSISPEPASIEAIQKFISRSDDDIEVFQDRRFFLAKLDVGAFQESAFIAKETVVTLTGEPVLISPEGHPRCRADDLSRLCRELSVDCYSILRDCHGSFSLCCYNPATGSLFLCTDRVGVRALYFHIDRQFIFFSSNLRILENITAVPKRMDIRGVTEKITFGYPLGDRTPYFDIRVLRGGESLSCHNGEVRRCHYFRWDQVPPTRLEGDALIDAAYTAFSTAVGDRVRPEKEVISFLSSGLDSRCVVAMLHTLGKRIRTVTFGYPEYPDARLARLFGALLGTDHVAVPVSHSQRQAHLKASYLRDHQWTDPDSPLHPRLVFSGDGGSVGLGHVYLEERLVDLLRQGNEAAAIKHYLRYKKLPRKIIQPKLYPQLSRVLWEGVKEELGRLVHHDPVRRFHLFLIDNDQRRHLHYLYEDLDRTRVEFQLPFFDGRFLELVVSAPADVFLRHRFYYRWLERFPKETTAIPWQAYPGHLPCPLPDMEGSRTQWQPRRGDTFARSRPLLRRCQRALLQPKFPTSILRRARILAAVLLHSLRIRSYAYVLKGCAEYQTYFQRCRGNMILQDSPKAPSSSSQKLDSI